MTPSTLPNEPAAASPAGAALRSLSDDLNTSAGALAALAAALNSRASGRVLAPAIATAVAGVLEALGVRESTAELPPAEVRTLSAELRVFAASHRLLAAAEPPAPGWTPTSAELIQAAGDVSTGLPRVIEQVVAPRLAGLADRLGAPGARFLDIGAGVAALSIEMARRWPTLEVVAIEPWAPALELARANVREAGHEQRIELRAESGERLCDESSYDLGWIPSLFIAEAVLPGVIERVHRALRPGAWLLLPVLRAGEGSLAGRVVQLRAALWGGSAPTLGEASAWLTAAGFVDLQGFVSAPTSATGLLAARKRREARDG